MFAYARHLLLALAVLLPLQGLAGALMLNCEHQVPVAKVVVHDAHASHHGHQASADSVHASHGQHPTQAGTDGLSCDDCQYCDLCASPALTAAGKPALSATPTLAAPVALPAFDSIVLDDPRRPPRPADRA